MAYEELCVSGAAIRPGVPRCPVYLPTRKFYHASYFHDDRYRHEIANHYRDFKRRPRLRRRKRGQISNTCGKAVVSNRHEMPHEYLQELPMAKQELPRFQREYTPRTRRKLCDEIPQDLVCNDTLRRIHKARKENDSEQLKDFANRHLERRLHRFVPSNEKGLRKIIQSEKCSNKAFDLLKSNNRTQQRRRTLGKLESADGQLQRLQAETSSLRPHQAGRHQTFRFGNDNCGATQTFRKGRNCFSRPAQSTGGADKANTLSYYLQLATDYYEQGFLNNLKYLENVGERNQLRRKRLQQQQLRHSSSIQKGAHECTSVSSISGFCEANASSLWPQQQTTDDSIVDNSEEGDYNNSRGICNPILKIIAKRRSFRIYRFNDEGEREPTGVDGNWPIRIQIKRADSVAALATQTSGTGNGKRNCKPFNNSSVLHRVASKDTSKSGKRNCCNSMNLQLQQLQQGPNINYSQQHHNSSPSNKHLIDALIDNLQQLEIEDHPTNLPRITLSDYTHRYHTEATSATATAAAAATTTSHLSNKHCTNTVLLRRQESIDLPSPKLDLPPNSVDYQCEARPP